ncbi:MAG: MBL fold metallo-hydrolase [Chloroflexota bacterium]|nr:MBL fold metallo-hydrolase [Chloroflexia bacterium]MDQ3226915.1 MBL fold metallo-hydrolase [Chloroflexota bacterium]
MQRRLTLLAILIALGLATPFTISAQEATPSAPAGEVQQFADDTYSFSSGGYVSLFIVTDEGVIATEPGSLVDPGRAEAYKAAIASVTDQPVRYVIYSHDHADHSTGGAVFADTATFIAHHNAVDKIAARNDPNTPVPQIAFNDELTVELGGKTIELYYTGRNHSDNSIVLLYPERRLLFAVDFIPVSSLPYQNLPDAYPDEWIASLQWVDENLDFDTLVIGHPPGSGTKENVGQVRMYLEDLTASVEGARSEGLADNSPEMVDAVRADLEADYGAWANFDEWLPLNVEGLITAETSGADATPTP